MSTLPISPQILAVNDAHEVLAFFVDLLEDEGYRVTIQSLVTLDLAAIAQLAPDVILLDAMWLTARDWTLLQELTSEPRTRAIPIVLCTIPVMCARTLQARLGGVAVHIVPKPYTLDALLAAIAGAVATTP